MNGLTQGRGTSVPITDRQSVARGASETVTYHMPREQLEAELAKRYGGKLRTPLAKRGRKEA